MLDIWTKINLPTPSRAYSSKGGPGEEIFVYVVSSKVI